MPVKQVPGILFVLLMLWQAANGQSKTGDFSVHRGSYTFRISHENDILARSRNVVVKQLALHLTKATDNTHFEVAYSYKLLSVREENEILIFSFLLDIDNISGDVKAGVFDISDVLKPRCVALELSLIDGGGQVFDTVMINLLEPGKTETFRTAIQAKPGFFSGFADVKINSVRFFYEEKQQADVINRLGAIKAYQAAGMLCDSIQKDADRLNRQVVNPSPGIALEIFQLSCAVEVLGQQYYQWATIPGNSDPEHLRQKQKMLAYRVTLIQQLFLKQAARVKMQLPGINMEELARWWVADQLRHLNEKRFPGFAAPVFYKLGKLSFTSRDLAFAYKSLALMIKTTDSEVTAQVYAKAFCDAAVKIYLQKGARLSSEFHYSEAADLLGNAFGLCSAVPFTTCPDRLFQQQARAYYGTYYSYLDVARKALASNLPQIASGYVASAAAFQKENSRFILLNSQVKELSKSLVEIWLNMGNAALESGRLTKALHDFEKAEWASSVANAGIASDMISQKVISLRAQISNLRRQ